MSYEEEDTCVSYEEEDTCVSYEEEDTCGWVAFECSFCAAWLSLPPSLPPSLSPSLPPSLALSRPLSLLPFLARPFLSLTIYPCHVCICVPWVSLGVFYSQEDRPVITWEDGDAYGKSAPITVWVLDMVGRCVWVSGVRSHAYIYVF